MEVCTVSIMAESQIGGCATRDCNKVPGCSRKALFYRGRESKQNKHERESRSKQCDNGGGVLEIDERLKAAARAQGSESRSTEPELES